MSSQNNNCSNTNDERRDKKLSKKAKGKKISELLEIMYPDADCTLNFYEPWKLLIAAILAAQCTDARVNIVCKPLFAEFPTIKSIADIEISVLEDRIRSCGFYHVKARSIKGSMQRLIEDYSSEVPSNIKDLLSLPGVGRKIANLILGDCYGKQAIVVDTHCSRISKLIGFTDNNSPEKIEQDLMKCIPKEKWTSYGHRIVAHGRAICIARSPKCKNCGLRCICKKGMEIID